MKSVPKNRQIEPDIATLANFERRVVAMLYQIDEHEGRAVMQQAVERLLNGSVLAVYQLGGRKRLSEVLEQIDHAAVWFDDLATRSPLP